MSLNFRDLIKVIDVDTIFREVSNSTPKAIKEVVTIVLAENTDGTKILGIGKAKTHPDDLDLATKKTGSEIALSRAYVDVLRKTKTKSEEEDKMVSEGIQALEAEIQALIDDKEKFYKRIRAIRSGDTSNKVQFYAMSEDNKKAVKL